MFAAASKRIQTPSATADSSGPPVGSACQWRYSPGLARLCQNSSATRPVGAAGDLVEDADVRQHVDRRPRAGDRRLPVIERLGEHEGERRGDCDAGHDEATHPAAATAAGAREIAVDAGAQRRAEAVGSEGVGCHGCSPPASAVRSRRSARETRRRAAAG